MFHLLLRICLLALNPAIVCSLQWPSVQLGDAERWPNIELSLAPPVRPWPQVATTIGNLESSREKTEDISMGGLQREFNKAGVEARQRVGETFGKMMKLFDDPSVLRALSFARRVEINSTLFRQLPQETLGAQVLSARVNVLPVSPPDPSLKGKIDMIEHRRSEIEKNMFQAAFGEVRSLIDFVVNELEAELHSHLDTLAISQTLRHRSGAGFLEDATRELPTQTHIRIAPADMAYPTVESMVQAMENRRDTTEHLVQQRILEKELDFLRLCNHAMEDGLKSAVDRLLAQYNTLLRNGR